MTHGNFPRFFGLITSGTWAVKEKNMQIFRCLVSWQFRIKSFGNWRPVVSGLWSKFHKASESYHRSWRVQWCVWKLFAWMELQTSSKRFWIYRYIRIWRSKDLWFAHSSSFLGVFAQQCKGRKVSFAEVGKHVSDPECSEQQSSKKNINQLFRWKTGRYLKRFSTLRVFSFKPKTVHARRGAWAWSAWWKPSAWSGSAVIRALCWHQMSHRARRCGGFLCLSRRLFAQKQSTSQCIY